MKEINKKIPPLMKWAKNRYTRAALALSLILGASSVSNAQLAINYPLTVSNGTYSSISSTGTNIAAMAADTYSENITGLPGFTVNGVTYNNARVTSNGSLVLYASTAPTSSPSTPLSTAITNGAVAISPLGGDLHISSVATTAFYWQVIGNEIIFEWQNYSRYASGGGSDILNFQARLNTSTGAISFVYGTCTPGSQTSSFQVGWKTNAQTAANWATDVNNLMINVTGSPNTCTWENAVTGNANNSTMYLNTANSGVAPASGLTYTWAPPAVAVAPVRTFAAVSAITDNSATLSWTASTGATQYNVRYRAVGSCSWTNFSGNPVMTNTATLAGLNADTSYQIQVQASDGTNNSIWSHIPTSAAGSGTNGYIAAGTFKTAQLACTGTPSAGTISGTTVRPTCGGSTPSPTTVTVTGQTTGVSGITYQWEKSTDNTNWSNATGTGNATITYTIPAHVAGQTEYYRLKATCTASTLFGYSDVLQITDPAAPATSATNIGTSALGNTTATVTWTNGSGTRRYVVINTTNSFTAPVDGSGAALTASAAYAGTGEQIIYDGTGTSVAVTGLSPVTTYHVRVYEYMRCGSTAPYSYYYQTATGTNNPGSFITELSCTPADPSSGCSGDNITSVALETLSDTGLTCSPYYEDRTASQNAVPQLGAALTIPMSVGVGNGGTENVGVWIDYNQNGAFEASEFTALGSGNNVIVNGTISVPSTATLGTTKMRVRSRYSTAITGNDACTTFTYGTTRDYTVAITAPPSCIAPTAVTASNATLSSVDISWTAPTVGTTPASYDVYYTTSSTVPDGSTVLDATNSVVVTTGTTTPINGLTADTLYYVWVRSNCGAGTSTWAGTTFRTGYCIPTGGTSSTAYYINNVSSTGGSTNLAYTASSYNAYVNNSAQQVSASPGDTVTLSLGTSGGSTYYYYTWVDWNNNLNFNDAGETILATTTYSATGTASIAIPAGQAMGQYRIRVASSYTGVITNCGPAPYGNYVDFTLNVGAPPTCIVPTAVTVSNPTPATLDVEWTAPTTGTPPASYDVYYSTTNTAPTASTPLNATNSVTSTTITATIPGLAPATTYYIWVRSNCGGGDFSAWSSTVASGITLCQPPAILTTTGDTVCPNSTAVLAATADAGATIKWYDAATGGNEVGTGTSFTTPALTATTNYWVSASTGTNGNVGVANAISTSGYSLEAGLNFTAISNFTLEGVYVYPMGTGAGTAKINLLNGTTIVETITVNLTGSGSPYVKTFVPLNWNIPAGDYSIRLMSVTGGVTNLIRESGTAWGAYPLTLSGVVSITSGYISGTSTAYYFFYDWKVVTGCESARTQVTATVDTGCMGTSEAANAKAVKVYPNPFKDVLNISDVDNVKTITVMDISGRIVKTIEKVSSTLNLSDLKEGLYLVNLNYKDGKSTSVKVIKK